MRQAVLLAEEAAAAGEVPVGCIITDTEGQIIGRGRNRTEQLHDACAHAELEAIREACTTKGDWRLSGCTIYITLEPCPMCTGAIINARIPTVVFGAKDEVTGSCGSVINLFMERYGHEPKIVGGICESECSALLKSFFERLRKK